MSESPARLSRRSLLRGAASVTVLAAVAAATSCTDTSSRSAGDDAGGSEDAAEAGALLRLAHAVDASAATTPEGTVPGAGWGAIGDDDVAVRVIDEQAAAVQGDFAAGRTHDAAGWLLSATEVQVLATYAGTCPLPAC